MIKAHSRTLFFDGSAATKAGSFTPNFFHPVFSLPSVNLISLGPFTFTSGKGGIRSRVLVLQGWLLRIYIGDAPVTHYPTVPYWPEPLMGKIPLFQYIYHQSILRFSIANGYSTHSTRLISTILRSICIYFPASFLNSKTDFSVRKRFLMLITQTSTRSNACIL